MLAVLLQVAGLAAVVAGVLVLFGAGVAVITAGVFGVLVGTVLERENG